MLYAGLVVMVLGIMYLSGIFGKKGFCPGCYRKIKLTWYGSIECPYCGAGTHVEFGGGQERRCHSGNKTILIFEDDMFWSFDLLLTPPNKIEVPQGTSFREKVILILNTLDNKLFKLTTKLVMEDTMYLPEIHLIHGQIRYVIHGFRKEHLKFMHGTKYSFYDVI
jgi:hypothetical protein